MSDASETIQNDLDKRFLRAVFVELNLGVNTKLTGWFLGVYTGYLRDTTNAIIQNGMVYFGTMAWYGYNFEIGDWSIRRPDAGYNSGYRAFREKRDWKPQNRWTGEHGHRPFLSDTIKDDTTRTGIEARLKGNPLPPKHPKRTRV